MPVIFILLLPVAFAASVKDDDRVDNFFSFTFDADEDELVTASSSVRHKQGDDVFFTVSIADKAGRTPLLGRVRFGLIADEGVRYNGTVSFEVVSASGGSAYEADKPVSFTLRPKKGKRAQTFRFPFDLPDSGDYSVRVTFGR